MKKGLQKGISQLFKNISNPYNLVLAIIYLTIVVFCIHIIIKVVRSTISFIELRSAKSYLGYSYLPKPVLDEDNNTITWLIHMYPPMHNAGAEWMAHAMNKHLIKDDYHVNVVLNDSKEESVHDFERVHIINRNNKAHVENAITHSSVLLSHLDNEPNAIQTAVVAERPLVLVIHNHYRKKYLTQFIKILPKNLYLIHNSYWIKEFYASFNIPSIVVYPPVYWNEYLTETSREYVTLINLNSNKGGDVLIQIAKAMPDIKFMGVIGGYDDQIKDSTLKNITYVPNTPFIQSIYAKTDILLVPSKEESWGRVAVEAMSSGIPVISNPTPGLLESCGEAGIFCKRTDIDAWVREIRRLKSDKEYYASVSAKCSARAKELDPTPQLEEMSKWLKTLKWR